MKLLLLKITFPQNNSLMMKFILLKTTIKIKIQVKIKTLKISIKLHPKRNLNKNKMMMNLLLLLKINLNYLDKDQKQLTEKALRSLTLFSLYNKVNLRNQIFSNRQMTNIKKKKLKKKGVQILYKVYKVKEFLILLMKILCKIKMFTQSFPIRS